MKLKYFLKYSLLILSLIRSATSIYSNQKNVYGEDLKLCSKDPLTGWFRDGFCRTDSRDFGTHTVCSIMSQQFLEFTKSQGNDLSTPRGGFPGLSSGDRWCLCSLRWKRALKAGVAPPVLLTSTQKATLKHNKLEALQNNAAKELESSSIYSFR